MRKIKLKDSQKLSELARLTDDSMKSSHTRLKAWGKLFYFNEKGEIIRIIRLDNVVSKSGVSYTKQVVLADDTKGKKK